MKYLKKTYFFILLSIFGICAQAMGGAWPQKKRGYYIKFSSSYLFTKKEFNHVGDELDIFEEHFGFHNASFRDINLTVYLEYGLTNRITIIGNLPFKILSPEWDQTLGDIVVGHTSPRTTGLSDLMLSTKFSLFENPFALSLQGGIKLPLGYDNKPDNDGAPLGTGNFDTEGHLLIGRSLYPLPMYVTGGIGYRKRGGRLNDEILYNAEIGYNAGKFLFKVTLDALKNTKEPPDIYGQTVNTPLEGGGGTLPDIIVGDQDITKISPSIIYNFNEGLAVQGEILNIIGGKNTVSGTIYSLGLVFSR